MTGGLGNHDDFSTDVLSDVDGYEITIEKSEIKELVQSFSFRGDKSRARSLTANVRRWRHRDEARGCGPPICAIVDMRPKRFKSMCSLIKWMKQEGHYRRVFEVQKGSCEDASN